MFKLAVVLDMQNDFVTPDGAVYVPNSQEIVPTLNEYLSCTSFENGYVGVVFPVVTHKKDEYHATAFAKENPDFPPHCFQGTEGFNVAIDPSVMPEKTRRFILNRPSTDMWLEGEYTVRPYKISGEFISHGGETPRDEFFHKILSTGVDEVELSGVANEYNINQAIKGFINRDFTVRIYDNLVAGYEKDIHQIAEENFKTFLDEGQLIIE